MRPANACLQGVAGAPRAPAPTRLPARQQAVLHSPRRPMQLPLFGRPGAPR